MKRKKEREDEEEAYKLLQISSFLDSFQANSREEA